MKAFWMALRKHVDRESVAVLGILSIVFMMIEADTWFVWLWIPYSMLIFVAALMGDPDDKDE